MTPDGNGDELDGVALGNSTASDDLLNFFNSMYGRKVTVAHPGNQSMVVVIWAKLYSNNVFDTISKLVVAINRCTSNFSVEVAGFTHDAVSCFIPNPKERLSPSVYKKAFDDNIASIRGLRHGLTACRLVANRNMQNVSLDLNEDTLARICAEYSALMCEHYQQLRTALPNYDAYPFESFGVSSIIFDLAYFKKYLRNRAIIDKLKQEGVDNRTFGINALAQQTNPIIQATLDKIHGFHQQAVVPAKAGLALNSQASATNVVGQITQPLQAVATDLRTQIDQLLTGPQTSVFESEALLCLLLGNDSYMFDTSVVSADELLIDDIIDESARFFVNLDADKTMLQDVTQAQIKKIRSRMRNIAVANRQRKERLQQLAIQRSDSSTKHIGGNGYHFGGTDYRIDLTVDDKPLEQIYQPHEVSINSVDLRNLFGPVRSQGTQGCCAAFAVASVIEALRKDSNRYSPAFLYWNARLSNNETDKDSGASLYGVIKAATEKGVCPEDDMPYQPEVYNEAPSTAANDAASDCRVLEAKTVNVKLQDIKSAISDGYPVIVAVRVFDSFSETQSGFVSPPSAEELDAGERKDGHGNHAMVVCGYSDHERVFVVRNSWGESFGDKGYCYIPYSYARQFFRQACIITNVTAANQMNDGTKRTINFNMADNNIEAAILRNLISEDELELRELGEKSKQLRQAWTNNVAMLGNVNNQQQLTQQRQQAIAKEIAAENDVIEQLQLSENDKIKQFKKTYIKVGCTLAFIVLLTWLFVYWFPSSTIAWIAAGAVTAIGVIFALDYAYRWRKYRQDLRDEIQHHASNVDYLRESNARLAIDAHIHGTILQQVNKERLSLMAECTRLQAFNASLVQLYQEASEAQRSMTPSVPYPFRAVLDNPALDRYYAAQSGALVGAIDLHTLFANYTKGDNIATLLENDNALNCALISGLQGFTMRAYIVGNNQNQWPFLPGTNNIGQVVPDLDARAIPFSPYTPSQQNPMEKYIFIAGVQPADMNDIRRFITPAPQPVDGSNPYAISLLTISRFDIDS